VIITVKELKARRRTGVEAALERIGRGVIALDEAGYRFFKCEAEPCWDLEAVASALIEAGYKVKIKTSRSFRVEITYLLISWD
jgi:hypothetical protein